MSTGGTEGRGPSALTGNDAIVIGAGLGGLVCATELARQGLKVCVLERHRVAGGYAHAFTRKGFNFNVSSRFIGGLSPGYAIHGILDSLGVFSELRFSKTENLFRMEYPDTTVDVPNDKSEILEHLGELFPDQRPGLRSLFSLLKRIKQEVVGANLGLDGDNHSVGRISERYVKSTFQDILREHITDKRLEGYLSQMWSYVGLPPSSSAANFSACVFSAAWLEGGYQIVGGGTHMVRLLVDRLRELGGELLLDSPVARILVEDGEAKGVILESGEELRARAVVSGADPYHTFFDLLPGEEVSKIYRFRLKEMQPSVSAYTTYLGLDCKPSQVGIAMGHTFVNHGYDLDEAWRRISEEELSHTDWCVTSAEGLDEHLEFPEGGVVTIVEPTSASQWFSLDGARYQDRKRAAFGQLMKKYTARFPKLKEHVVVAEYGTPRTMARFSNNYHGAIYGFAQTPDQSGSKRLSNRTPIDGLYLTGAWTWVGGTYEGAMISGAQTAGRVVEDLDSGWHKPRIALRPDTPAEAAQEEKTRDSSIPAVTALEDAEEHYRFKLPVRIYGDDLNSRGNADASSYLRYMDRARMEAVEEICAAKGETSWITEHMVTVYRIEARLATIVDMSDVLEVRTGVRKISTHRAAFDQRIYNIKTGEMVLDAVVEVLFLDEDKHLIPVPEGLESTDGFVPSFDEDRTEPLPFTDEEHFPFRTSFRVYFEDTDLQAITFHVSYVRFCERALFDMVRTLWPYMGAGAWMDKHRSYVSRVDVRYLNSSELGDRLEVRTGLVKLTSHRLTFGQRIVKAGTKVVVSDAVTDVEFRDENGQIVPIPQQVVDVSMANLPDKSAFKGGWRIQLSIGKHLATPENLELVKKLSWKFGRPKIIDLGMKYYDEHPAQAQLIADNLGRMGMKNSGADLDEVLREIVIHYYEKLFVLVKTYEAYWIAMNRIDVGDSMAHFEEAAREGKSVFLAQSHFGATYLMASVLMARGHEVSSIGNFPEPVGSMIRKTVDTISERYRTAKARLLSVSDPSLDIPGEMMRLLLTGKIVSNVFDENNEFCRPVKLLGREIFGGTGMDLILRNFKDEKVILLTPFLIRTSEDTFRYEVDRHYLANGDIIESFYRSLEKRIKDHPAQWYFIHELHESFEDKRKTF